MGKIGQLIQTLRISKGLTQAQLASEIGVTDKAVGKWEQGVGDPDLSLIKPIATFFGITTDELISGKLDEFSKDITKSIYEKIVLSGIDKLSMFLDKGIDVLGTDEYNRTILDYIYKYRDIDFLEYALKNNWFTKYEFAWNESVGIQSYYGRGNATHEAVVFLQKQAYNYLLRRNPRISVSGSITKEQKLKLGIAPLLDSELNGKDFDKVIKHDLINTLSIIIEHERSDLLELFKDYAAMFKLVPNVLLTIFDEYTNRNSLNNTFLTNLISIDNNNVFNYLLKLSLKNKNNVLLHILVENYNPNMLSLTTENLDELVIYNDQQANDTILLRDQTIDQLNHHLAYVHNQYVFNKLPLSIQQKELKASTNLVNEDTTNPDIILYLDPKALIIENKLSLFKKYVSLVEQAKNEIDDLFDQIYNDSIASDLPVSLNAKIKQLFNKYLGKYFTYKQINFTYNSDCDRELEIRAQKMKEKQEFEEDTKDYVYLEKRINSLICQAKASSYNQIKKTLKKDIYNLFQNTFVTQFEININEVSEDILLFLISCLNQDVLNKVLNEYNGEKEQVIFSLLNNGAKFYKISSLNQTGDVIITILQTDFRTEFEIKKEEEEKNKQYDNVKTMLYKKVFDIK